MMKPRFRRAAALAIVPTLLSLAGCGDDDHGKKSKGAAGAGGAAGSAGAAGVDGGGTLLDPLFDDSRVPVTETVTTSGVTQPVDVVRDRYGHVHIFARNLEDLFYVQGLMMVADRAGMLELARRLALGRVAELFGKLDPGQIDGDIAMRTLGLGRVGKQMYDAIPDGSEHKRILDAFAAGVSAYYADIRAGTVTLPADFLGMPPEAFEPWEGWHSLAMGRVQSENLSNETDNEIELTELWDEVTRTFDAASTDPELARRAGFAKDVLRWAPSVDATPLAAFPDEPTTAKKVSAPGRRAVRARGLTASRAPGASGRPSLPAAAYDRSRRFVRALDRVKRWFGYDEHAGSNNWVVDGSHTDTGNAMLASDPHLGFTSPMVFWPCHLVVDDPDHPEENFDVTGLAFPGIPGVILGANEHIAWGATTSLYDVTDVWAETVADDGSGVMFEGKKVAFEHIPETVKVGNEGDEVTWDVLVVPHHGPVVPTINADHQVDPPTAATGALSAHWTGHQPTHEVEAVFRLIRATNVDEARAALNDFGVGSQNWVIADTGGNIAWTSHVLIPHRDPRTRTWDPATYTGVLPAFVLDGASGEHEWTGEFLDERYIPKAKNPAKGWIATANTDSIGTTLDNDPTNEKLPDGTPFYIGWEVAEGFRLGRIQERLTAATSGGKKMTVEEMADIQADTRSGLGARLAGVLADVLEKAEAEKAAPGTNPDLAPVVADPRYDAADVPDVLASLDKWGTEADYDAASGMSPDDGTPVADPVEANAAKATFLFDAWLVRALSRTLEDEARKVGGRQNVRTAFTIRGFLRIVEENPTTLATYDVATGQSALWDDLDTAGVVEKRDEVLGLALLDAIDDGNALFGPDRSGWRWGKLHTVRFDALNPLWSGLTMPATDDATFPNGWPRHGDMWNVDASNFSLMRAKGDPLSFDYGSGPVQRFVAEMTPDGPKIRTALPGGAVADSTSRHFGDEAELWRRNQSHEVPRTLDEVAASYKPGDEHLRYTPSGE